MPQHYNFLIYDGENLIGGAIEYLSYRWYFLELLHIQKEYRGKNFGKRLFCEIDKFASTRHWAGIRLETWDFQAKGFYEKQGFNVFGELDGCPPGTKLYFMKKVFHSNCTDAADAFHKPKDHFTNIALR